MIKWLPDLMEIDSYQNDWNIYLDAIYNSFINDFIKNKTMYKKYQITLTKSPKIDGKEVTFWHLISEGKIESERLPDLRRCERIKWPSSIIKNHNKVEVKIWENERKGDKRLLLFIEEEDYLVVLIKRKKYFLLCTAYLVKYIHHKRKLLKEWNEYNKKTGVS